MPHIFDGEFIVSELLLFSLTFYLTLRVSTSFVSAPAFIFSLLTDPQTLQMTTKTGNITTTTTTNYMHPRSLPTNNNQPTTGS
jgi:hypothetical protein